MRNPYQRKAEHAPSHTSVIKWITAFWAAALLLQNFSGNAWAEPPIIVGQDNMLCGSSDNDFSVLNFRTGRSYNWTFSGPVARTGSGRSVCVDGPASDECCLGGPVVITVTDSEGETGSIEVGSYDGDSAKEKYVIRARRGLLPQCAYPACGWAITVYNCDGSIAQGPDLNGGCCLYQIHCEPDDWCIRACDQPCSDLADFYAENYPYFPPNTSGCCPKTPEEPDSPSDLPPPADAGYGNGSPGCGERDPCCNGGGNGAGAPRGGGPRSPDGPGRDPGFVGNPISVYNGNKFERQNDVRIPSPNVYQLPFTRFYNSQSDEDGPMGFGWSHSYTVSLTQFYLGESFLRILDHTGRGRYFEQIAPGQWGGKYDEESSILSQDDAYFWKRSDGAVYRFSIDGRLEWIKDPLGNKLTLSYDEEDVLQQVLDEASGRTLSFQYDENGHLISVTGPPTPAVPDGILVVYEYDASDNLVSVTYPDGSGFTYSYTDPNDPHNLTERHDKAGNLLASWTYDDQDRAIENYTPYGRGVSIDYSGGNEVEVTDAYGQTRIFTLKNHNRSRLITDIARPGGCTSCMNGPVRFSYDYKHRIIEVEYANGAINQYDDFDTRDNAQTMIFSFGTPEERVITYTYHPDMDMPLTRSEASVLSEGQQDTVWDYDCDYDDVPNENPTRLVSRRIERGFTRDAGGAVVPYEHITTYHYNDKGALISLDGPLSGSQDTTTYTYDQATGDLLTVTLPGGLTTTYSDYDAAGNPGRITDPNGVETTYTYDGRNRIVSVEAAGIAETVNFNTAGRLAAITDGAGRTFSFSYDSTYGRLKEIGDPAENVIRYAYDHQGNPVEESAYDPAEIRHYYLRFDYHGPDRPGKLWKVINPDDTATVFEYDGAGQVTAVTDPLGSRTSYRYDTRRRLIQIIQPGGVTTSLSYDRHGNLARVTDAEGHITAYTYDDLGRLVQTISPDTGVTLYTYDAAGNLHSKTDAGGVTATYRYDPSGRLTDISYPGGLEDVSLSYDEGTYGKGRLSGLGDPSGSTAYIYDALGRLLREQLNMDGLTSAIDYAYDDSGKMTGITYPSGREVSYIRDDAGEVTSVIITKDNVSEILAEGITYLPFGPISGFSYGNGIEAAKTFDQAYRVTDISSGQVQNLSYSYNAAGDIIGITDNLDALRNQIFGYDNLSRLIQAEGIYGIMGYTYDQVGNRLNVTGSDGTDVYAYVAGTNRLAGIAGANPQSFSYDENGNTVSMGIVDLAYDHTNRLIKASRNGAVLGSYTYNTKGQRVSRVTSEGTVISRYSQEGNLISERDGTGKTIREYVWLQGELLAAVTPGTEPAADIVLDNGDGSVTFSGNWATDASASGCYGMDYRFHEPYGTRAGEIIVDNRDREFSSTGQWSPLDIEEGYYGQDYLQYEGRNGSSRASWRPVIPEAGEYSVFAWWNSDSNRATDATYTIRFRGGRASETVNQQARGGQWNLLGTFPFAVGR
jgi:YD repeat-containing protein